MDIEGYKVIRAAKKDQKKFIDIYGSSVKVSRYKYKLCFVKSINDGSVCGFCYPARRQIFIAMDAPDIDKTIIHEIMHAEIEATGLWQAPGFSRDIEEQMCELASHAVCTNYVYRRKR